MPDSYGMPLWMSPRFRCESSHAAPMVTKTNPIDTTANPTTYQIAGNRSSLLPPTHPVSPGGATLPLGSIRLVHPVGGTLHVLVRGVHDRPSRRPSPECHSI